MSRTTDSDLDTSLLVDFSVGEASTSWSTISAVSRLSYARFRSLCDRSRWQSWDWEVSCDPVASCDPIREGSGRWRHGSHDTDGSYVLVRPRPKNAELGRGTWSPGKKVQSTTGLVFSKNLAQNHASQSNFSISLSCIGT